MNSICCKQQRSMHAGLTSRCFLLPDFIEAPQSVNASLNTTAQFHCCAAAISLQWNVDGAVANSPVIQDRGITYESVSDESPSGEVVWNSTLSVNATKRNNNTIVFCMLYTDLEGGIAKSDVVYLIIESPKGKLCMCM